MPLVEQYPNWVSLDPISNTQELVDSFYNNSSVWQKRPPLSFFASCSWYKFPYCCAVPWYHELNSEALLGKERAELYRLASPIFQHANKQLGDSFVFWGAELNSVPTNVRVSKHADRHFYADYTTRVHAVLETNEQVLFEFENGTHHFATGECFIFNNKLQHAIRNTGSAPRLHLVMDFVPTSVFPYVERSIGPFGGHEGSKHILSFLPPGTNEYVKQVPGHSEVYPCRTVEELGL